MTKIFPGIFWLSLGGAVLSACIGGLPAKQAENRPEMSRSARAPSAFFGEALPVSPEAEQKMRLNGVWKQNCPVSIKDLARLTLTHWGFDGKPHQGELVVHKKLARDFLDIFERLYAAKFPIEKMRLIEYYEGNDEKSMADNNTSAFNCREITGRSGTFSQHSYGTAIDINPLQNPYLTPKSSALKKIGRKTGISKSAFLKKRGYGGASPVQTFCLKHPGSCIILPAAASPIRNQSITGIIERNGIAVRIFREKGFRWGGDWSNVLDYQHFEIGHLSFVIGHLSFVPCHLQTTNGK
ncbi:MAG: hypothetical protein GY862_18185 [Gammaproteobacteria bacterium]|nr:hypothetical protein [Gammaproteobacteria bacterium]